MTDPDLKELREKAKREHKWLITLKIDGRHMKDDSMSIYAAVDLPMAHRLRDLGLEILRKGKP